MGLGGGGKGKRGTDGDLEAALGNPAEQVVGPSSSSAVV